jgi:hypothetical protein
MLFYGKLDMIDYTYTSHKVMEIHNITIKMSWDYYFFGLKEKEMKLCGQAFRSEKQNLTSYVWK